jgi:tetratricopeptide (TPR) repeat protein
MNIISFFSFKGGVGRTALLTNLGAWWASEGKIVLLIDMDLAAPGLSYSPLAGDWRDPRGTGLGISDMLDVLYQDYDRQAPEISYLPVTALIRDMTDPTGDEWGGQGRLMMIGTGSERFVRPAGGEGMPGAIPTLDGTDSQPSREREALRTLACNIRKDLAEWRTGPEADARGIDYVLIDTRTGLPELVDLSLGFLADRMVLVSGLNGQNQYGLKHTLRALIEQQRVPVDEFPAYVTLVLSPIPGGEDEATIHAVEQARGVVRDAMRLTSSGVREIDPPVFQLHYTPVLAYDERPLVLRLPAALYSREVKGIAQWLDQGALTPVQVEMLVDEQTRTALETLVKAFQQSRQSRNRRASRHQDHDRPNPATDLPPWFWALPREQQTPEARERRRKKLFAVPVKVAIDADEFATRLSWATMSSADKQKLIDALPRITRTRLDEAIRSLEQSKRDLVDQAAVDAVATLGLLYQIEKDWAKLVNNKEQTGLRRFLCDPVDGHTLFKTWEPWPDYWVWLAQDLLTVFNDSDRALAALDRAAAVGDPVTVAMDLPVLADRLKVLPEVRARLHAKARALAPGEPWVEVMILFTEDQPDPALARQLATTLLARPPRDGNSGANLGVFVSLHLPDLAPRVERFVRHAIETGSQPANAWYILGVLLAEHLHRYDEAEAAFRTAIDRNPKAASWHELGALLADHLHRYDEAEAAYRTAIGRDPKDAGLRNGLACLYADVRFRPDQALVLFDAGLALETNQPYLRVNRGAVLAHLGRRPEAAADLALALRGFQAKDTSKHRALGLLVAVLLNDAGAPALEAALRPLATLTRDFGSGLALLVSALAADRNVATARDETHGRLATHSQRLWAVGWLYDLAGWRPECREQARAEARRFYTLPAGVLASLKGVPPPEFRWRPFLPFLAGESEGAGDPRDSPIWSGGVKEGDVAR